MSASSSIFVSFLIASFLTAMGMFALLGTILYLMVARV